MLFKTYSLSFFLNIKVINLQSNLHWPNNACVHSRKTATLLKLLLFSAASEKHVDQISKINKYMYI